MASTVDFFFETLRSTNKTLKQLRNETVLSTCRQLHGPHYCNSSNTGSDCNAREHNRFAEDYVFISSKHNNSGVENDNLHLSVLENDFTIGNSFWFAIGTLMQQGSDLNPKVQYLLQLQY